MDARFDGPDGLWRATEYRYEVLILELMLPGRNGREQPHRSLSTSSGQLI